MRLVNLTQHDVVIEGEGGERIVVAPAGPVARLRTETDPVGSIAGVPVVAMAHGEVENLPAAEPGYLYLVSLMVAAACTERDDVMAPDTSPGSVVRDENGRTVAVKRLAKIRLECETREHCEIPDGESAELA